jgi:hypothetical protein
MNERDKAIERVKQAERMDDNEIARHVVSIFTPRIIMSMSHRDIRRAVERISVANFMAHGK